MIIAPIVVACLASLIGGFALALTLAQLVVALHAWRAAKLDRCPPGSAREALALYHHRRAAEIRRRLPSTLATTDRERSSTRRDRSVTTYTGGPLK